VKRAKTFDQHWLGALFCYVILDVMMVAAGMGVPVFCILLGFPVGWFTAMRSRAYRADVYSAMKLNLRYVLVTSAVTFVLMAALWGRMIPRFFDPVVDAGGMGLPLILYEPRASFVGWLVLMIVVAPALQFAWTLFGSYVTYLWRPRWWRDGVPTNEQRAPWDRRPETPEENGGRDSDAKAANRPPLE
jgi:hypothetical protein